MNISVYTYENMYVCAYVYTCLLCMYMYMDVYIGMNAYICKYVTMYPPDPINHLCSLTGKQISEKYFTYRSVQMFKILFWRFYSPESDPLHKIMRYWFYYSIQLGLSFPSDHDGQVEMFCNTVVPAPKGHFGGGQPLNIFTSLIGAGGYIQKNVFIYMYRHTTIHVYI